MSAALVSFCPNCWSEIESHDAACLRCGYRVEKFDALEFEDKLLFAIGYRISENRMLAIQLLGELRSRLAVEAFATMLDQEEDPYVLGAIARALHGIGEDACRPLLSKLRSHPSIIVRRAAEEA